MAEIRQTEIARLARVSQATVSRVLNNDPQVNEELRQRVLAVVEALGYVPDARAQSLRAQRTRLLGLVVHRAPTALAHDPFFSALIASIIEQAGKQGYHLCVDAARTVKGQRAIYEELLRTRRVDGLILVESETRDERIARLTAEGFPFVLIGRYEPEDAIYTVDNDNIGAARMATEYLLQQGRRRIAYIGGPAGLTVTRDRLRGYRDALQAWGMNYDARLVAFGAFSEQGGARAMCELLSLPHAPDAVLALDDVLAIGAMREAQRHQLRIPEDIAFIGFNDTPLCSFVEPSLTSVAIDIAALARAATQRLIDLIEGRSPSPRRLIVPSRLVPRESA
ncbi:HTH-type transcriptional repressor CytR [bacterium HR15]|nr:HTH-type transcriptional repressor CytR [bacterium HR15]